MPVVQFPRGRCMFVTQVGEYEQGCLSCNQVFRSGVAIIWVEVDGYSYQLGENEEARCPRCKEVQMNWPRLFRSDQAALQEAARLQQEETPHINLLGYAA